MTDQIVVERHGFVLEIRLSNPPYNGLSGTMFREFVEAVQSASRDDAVRAIVTTSSVDNWCVGGELGDLAERLTTGTLSDLLHESVGDQDLSLLDRRFDRLGPGRLVLAIRACHKPMIAAVGGAAAGGGMALALWHDVRFASERALFTTAFAKLGLTAEMGISYLLPRIVGEQVAADVMLTARRIDATEAFRRGMVLEVVDSAALREHALAYAERLAARPPFGTQATVRLLRGSWDRTLDAQLDQEWPYQVAAFSSPETQEAIRAFTQH
jgi:enoyl-CoA hydratase/carnithine racemase